MIALWNRVELSPDVSKRCRMQMAEHAVLWRHIRETRGYPGDSGGIPNDVGIGNQWKRREFTNMTTQTRTSVFGCPHWILIVRMWLKLYFEYGTHTEAYMKHFSDFIKLLPHLFHFGVPYVPNYIDIRRNVLLEGVSPHYTGEMRSEMRSSIFIKVNYWAPRAGYIHYFGWKRL